MKDRFLAWITNPSKESIPMDLHIKDVLKNYIKKDKAIGDAYYSQKIKAYWTESLSESITSRIHHISFKSGKLIVKTYSSPLRNELFNNREQLRLKINKHLGEEVVNLIHFG